MALTPKRQRFVEEYLVDLNAAAAYRRAGYSVTTDHAASVGGARLLANVGIAAAVEAAQAKRAKAVQVSAEWVLQRLVRNERRAVRVGEGAVVNKALELIGRHLGMFKDKVEVTTPATLHVVEKIVDAGEPDQNG